MNWCLRYESVGSWETEDTGDESRDSEESKVL
jgi:hypothetical protein